MLKRLASLTLVTIGLAFTHAASAKLTLYSTEEIILSVMDSTEIETLKQSYGHVTWLEASETEASEMLQSFRLKLVLTTETPIGERSCFFEGNVLVGRDSASPAGIVASKIMEPTFGLPLCQK